MSYSLVSIIVPFHNEERYLKRAVLSVLAQTYTDYELILVNDNSTDDSLEIAAGLESENQNIKVIDLPQQRGPGKARNVGIAVASGSYVAFLDSDDELEPTAIEKLIKVIETDHSDIAVSKYGYYNRQGMLVRTGGWTVEALKKDAAGCIGCMYNYTIANTSWAKLYKTTVVRQSAFIEDSWFEDRPFLLNCFLNAEKVSFIGMPLWRIHARASSVTRRKIELKHLQDSRRIFRAEVDIIRSTAQRELYEPQLFQYQVDEMIRSLIILCSDRNQVSNLSELQSSFREWLGDFCILRKQATINDTYRTHLDLAILSMYKFLGWKMTWILLPFLKPATFKAIQRLRAD
jgi:glycosyltransferase involved in cell wall biosynthesis